MKRRTDDYPAPRSVERKTYSSPRVEYFGPVTLTAMPGGSVGLEGASGKAHKFAVGHDDEIHG